MQKVVTYKEEIISHVDDILTLFRKASLNHISMFYSY